MPELNSEAYALTQLREEQRKKHQNRDFQTQARSPKTPSETPAPEDRAAEMRLW